ncbi:MAG: hypothetical protein CENE_03232 [Candidatus Celerinatantimonas neptuna]|nr:MAG: hypothetical protein CENE_03232 [Candidatus Celerinatantimonas neptuna]
MKNINCNPLNSTILKILAMRDSPIKEYHLIQMIKKHPFMVLFETPENELQLFRQHFITTNSLYQLQNLLFTKSYTIEITPLAIQLILFNKVISVNTLQLEDPLRDYYLNWQNLYETDKDDVQQLLQSFWGRFSNIKQRASALKMLKLPLDATPAQIRKRYRELALYHHPDRGGNSVKFQQISKAYQQLKNC